MMYAEWRCRVWSKIASFSFLNKILGAEYGSESRSQGSRDLVEFVSSQRAASNQIESKEPSVVLKVKSNLEQISISNRSDTSDTHLNALFIPSVPSYEM
jgi:hypothetical protein